MRIKSPVRFMVAVVTFLVIIWMCYNFVIALKTGETFSIFGNGMSEREAETFVVAGVDEDGYRTDLILLCQLNRAEKRIQVLQIPRDTKVTNKRNDKKINSAYFSGFDVMSREIEQVAGLAPDHYVMVGFDGFQEIVDAVGGVTLEIPFAMQYEDPAQDLVIDLPAGKQKLNGEKAEMYMRYRKGNDGNGYAEGDVGRLSAQKELYNAIGDKLMSPTGWLRIPAVYSAVKKNTETNFTSGEIFGIMMDVLRIGKENIEIDTLPGTGKYIGGGSYFVCDTKAAEKLIAEKFTETVE